MTQVFRRMRGPVTALAVAGALGFGATQAVSAPRAEERLTCTIPQWTECISRCQKMGGTAWDCVNGICYCAVGPGGPGGGGTTPNTVAAR